MFSINPLTTNLDTLTGSSANDLYVGTLDVSGGSTVTLGDSITDSGGSGDTFKVTSNEVAASDTNTNITLSGIENVLINGVVAGAANLFTFNAAASKAAGLVEIDSINIGDLTVTNIGTAALGVGGFVSDNGAAQAITAAGANTLNLFGVSVGDTALSALNVDVSGGASTGVVQVVKVNSTGSANTISDLKIGNLVDGAATLNIAATQNFKTTTVTELVASKLKYITATGAASSVNVGTIGSTALVSVDASGLTTGGMTVGIGANTATTFVGGTGNDTVDIASGKVMTGAINAGAGTADTLNLVTGASLTAATGALFTNFDVLGVANAGAVGTTQTYDPTLISGITSYKANASIGAVELINLAASLTVTVTGAIAGTAGLIATLKTATGGSDVVNVSLDNQNTKTTGVNNGASTTKLTSIGTETINIGSNGLVNNGGTANTITALDPLNTSLSKINVTGSQLFSLTTGAITNNLTIDGSTATGKMTINASASAAGVTALNINGGTKNDTLTASNLAAQTGSIYAGGRGDAITLGLGVDTLVYKAGTDSLYNLTGTAGVAGSGTMDNVAAGFATTTDKIDLTSLNTTVASQKFVDSRAYASTAAMTTATESATFFNDSSNIQRGAVFGVCGGDGYLFVDANHNGVFDTSSDLAVKLTGTVALAQADLIWG